MSESLADVVHEAVERAKADEARGCSVSPTTEPNRSVIVSNESRTNAMRDSIVAADPANAGLVMSRDQVVEKWCAANGKSKDALGVTDILAIRALPEWQHAG